MVERNRVGQMFTQVGDIVPLGCAVDHHVQAFGPARDHQIIEHAALFIEQQRIALHAQFKRGQIDWQQFLDRCIDALPRQFKLAHVRYVEQSGVRAGPQMFSNDALILNRHMVTRELDHPAAARAVPAIERQGQHFWLVKIWKLFSFRHRMRHLDRAPHRTKSLVPPLSRKPESFPWGVGPRLPLRRPLQNSRNSFQSITIDPRGPLA